MNSWWGKSDGWKADQHYYDEEWKTEQEDKGEARKTEQKKKDDPRKPDQGFEARGGTVCGAPQPAVPVRAKR